MNLFTNLKDLMPSALFHIVDATKGFGQKEGANGEAFPLYVAGGERVGPAIDAFVAKMPTKLVHRVFVSNDTHFPPEYKDSPEAAIFSFHQGFGTEQHEYLFDLPSIALRWRTSEVLKNQFDVWAKKTDLPDGIKLDSRAEEEAYARLFMPTELSAANLRPILSVSMQDYVGAMRTHGTKTVVLCGIATDYCVYTAIIGWLMNGFNVVFLTDLSQGIYKPEYRGAESVYEPKGTVHQGVANLGELIENRPILKQAFMDGRFRPMTSDELLREAA